MTPHTKDPPGLEVSLMGLLRVMHRWRWLVGTLTIGLPVIAAVIMLLTPNTFTARGTLLLEVSKSGGGLDMLGQLGALAGLPARAPTADTYLAILRSRGVGWAVADSLGLADHFEITAPDSGRRAENTLRHLHQVVEFTNPDAATLSIRATDTDPQMAARIVNAFLDRLVAANQTLSFSRARRTRRNVEAAIAQTEDQLIAARERLGEFQRTYGVFSLDDQTRATLNLIAELQGELIRAQTQRDALSGFFQENSAELRQKEHLVEALRGRIRSLVGSLEDSTDVGGGIVWQTPADKKEDGFLLPLSRVPDLAGRYARVVMDVKVLESKYTVLATQLEQTKIEESQSIPTFEVLDRAVRPFAKSGPNRTFFVAVAFVAGLLAGVLLAVLLEDMSRRVDEATAQELLAMLPAFVASPLGRLIGVRSGTRQSGT